MKIKYNKEILDRMSLFSSLTGVHLKDCFGVDEVIYFIVEEGQIGKAVGKGAANVRLLQDKLKRKIKIVEFSSDLIKFVKNLVFPIKVDVSDENDVIILRSEDRQVKGLLIGRNAKNLKMMADVVRRYFKIEDIKVE